MGRCIHTVYNSDYDYSNADCDYGSDCDDGDDGDDDDDEDAMLDNMGPDFRCQNEVRTTKNC